jgi:hypothetical protein
MVIMSKLSEELPLVNSNEDLEESVTTLNQVLELDPEDVVARQDLYETMQQLLQKDAFLAYQGETDVFYKVRTLSEFQFIHPKDRAIAEQFPPQDLPPARASIHWLGWAVVGLIPAGLGTLILAPLAVNSAIKLLKTNAEIIDRRRAWVVIGGAIVLWLIALIFIFIFVLHLV